MKFLFGHNIPSVVLMSLVLLANAQKSSNNLHRDLDFEELSRQNKITKQILEAFIQKKLGLARHNVRAPSIRDILPVPKQTEGRPIRELGHEADQLQDNQELAEDDNLQSVESEQIDSIYPDEGRSKKYHSPPYEAESDASRKRDPLLTAYKTCILLIIIRNFIINLAIQRRTYYKYQLFEQGTDF